MRQAVRAADADLPIVGPRLVAEGVIRSLEGRSFNTALLSGFALLALVLASVGIYGLMAYAVTQRTREIGIRLAIGATSADVLRLVVGQSARLTIAGALLGLAGAGLLTRIMRGLLFGVTALDPITFAAAALVRGGWRACWISAGTPRGGDRSADVDPARSRPISPPSA